MTPQEVTQLKAKRLTEDAVRRAIESGANDVRQANLKGMLRSSRTAQMLTTTFVSVAKDLRSKLVACYIETLGSALNESAASQEIGDKLNVLAQGFYEAHGRYYQILVGIVAMPDMLQSELKKLTAEVVDEIATAFYDAKHSGKTVTTVPSTTPIPDVGFVRSADLKSIAGINSEESAHCFDAGAFNAATIMAGSAMEAILLDLLQQHESNAIIAKAAPKKKLNEWGLFDVTEVCVELNLLHESAATLVGWVRQHRNFVHPGLILKSGQKLQREDANMAVGILALLCRDLKGISVSNQS